MATPFLSEISMFGGNFAPRGWAFCDGQLLPIAQNSALFSLLGTTYGGDGRTTFGLPDLRGRSPLHPGTGPGLSTRRWGEQGGLEDVALTAAQVGPHTHGQAGVGSHAPASQVDPAGAAFARSESGAFYGPPENIVDTGAVLISTGAGANHENRQPYTVINFIIALQGVFPSRS